MDGTGAPAGRHWASWSGLSGRRSRVVQWFWVGYWLLAAGCWLFGWVVVVQRSAEPSGLVASSFWLLAAG